MIAVELVVVTVEMDDVVVEVVVLQGSDEVITLNVTQYSDDCMSSLNHKKKRLLAIRKQNYLV
jgi:hypothetical protein